MSITVYHNPRCSKSRCALDYLKEKNIEFDVVEYLKETPDAGTLKTLLDKMGKKPEDILRKGEAIFKEKYKGKTLSDDEWIQAMVENPKLIERPIVVNGDKAVIARPTELIDDII